MTTVYGIGYRSRPKCERNRGDSVRLRMRSDAMSTGAEESSGSSLVSVVPVAEDIREASGKCHGPVPAKQ